MNGAVDENPLLRPASRKATPLSRDPKHAPQTGCDWHLIPDSPQLPSL